MWFVNIINEVLDLIDFPWLYDSIKKFRTTNDISLKVLQLNPDPAELSLKQGFTNLYLGKRKLAVRQHFQFFRNNKGFGAVLSLQNEMKMLHNYLWNPNTLEKISWGYSLVWSFQNSVMDELIQACLCCDSVQGFVLSSFAFREKALTFLMWLYVLGMETYPLYLCQKMIILARYFVFQAFFFYPYWGFSQEMSPFRPVLTVTYYSTLYCCHNIKQPRPSFG